MLERKIKAGISDIECLRLGEEGTKMSHHYILKLGIWSSAHIILTHIFFFIWNIIAATGSWITTLNYCNGETNVEHHERNKLLWSPLVLSVPSPLLSCPTPHNTDSVLIRENNASCSSLHCQHWKKGRTKNRHRWYSSSCSYWHREKVDGVKDAQQRSDRKSKETRPSSRV